MAYATVDDLIAAIGPDTYSQLTEPSYWDNANRGADALERASLEIDSYLCRQYTLPLATVPPVLKVICCDIAFYRLWRPEGVPDDLVTRYDKTVRWLRDLAEGKVGLGPTDYKVPVQEEKRISSVALTL